MEDLVALSWAETFDYTIDGLEREMSRCRGRDIDVGPVVWRAFEGRLAHRLGGDGRRVRVSTLIRCDDYRDVVIVVVDVSLGSRGFAFSWIYPSFLEVIRSRGRVQDLIRAERPNRSLRDPDERYYDRYRRPGSTDTISRMVVGQLASLNEIHRAFYSEVVAQIREREAPLEVDSGKAAVERLVSIVRVVGEALALQLASSLSLRGFVGWTVSPTPPLGVGRVAKSPKYGDWGVCPRHGLVNSETAEGRRACSICRRQLEAVRILVAIVRSILNACTQRVRDAVDWLISTTLLCGHILWEQLSDWHRRCLLLEMGDVPETLLDWDRRRGLFAPVDRPQGRTEESVEPIVEERLRFALLEMD